MAYIYHVFLSYRRFGEWPRWVNDKFLPLFKHWLGEELGEDPEIFFDQNILEAGTVWPHELGYALAHSKILVPLLSRQYFNSEWCKAEFAHMCAREDQCGFRNAQPPKGLIVPAVIHDGEELPKFATIYTFAPLQECTNVRMAKDSPTEEELSRRIEKILVPNVAKSIRRAPLYNPKWDNIALDKFLALFNIPAAKQSTLPSLGAP